jgi:hypothetical protein
MAKSLGLKMMYEVRIGPSDCLDPIFTLRVSLPGRLLRVPWAECYGRMAELWGKLTGGSAPAGLSGPGSTVSFHEPEKIRNMAALDIQMTIR